MLETIFSIALGISLAASCGLRAFMPLFIAGLLSRLFEDTLSLGETFSWLNSTPALIALGVAVVAEVAADKIPALDHILDTVQTPVRTIAGMLVAAAVMTDMPGHVTALVAIVAGGGAALSVHATKAMVRLGATATTGGVANPFISLGEDVACLAASALSVIFAVVAVIVAALTSIFVVVAIRYFFVRRKLKKAAKAAEAAGETAGDAEVAPVSPA
jgi:hypothetical protein